MTIEEVKELALRMMIEEHLYKYGDSDDFNYSGYQYHIERVKGGFELSTILTNGKVSPQIFPTLGRLFGYFFRIKFIKY